jgi:hypothetical protein
MPDFVGSCNVTHIGRIRTTHSAFIQNLDNDTVDRIDRSDVPPLTARTVLMIGFDEIKPPRQLGLSRSDNTSTCPTICVTPYLQLTSCFEYLAASAVRDVVPQVGIECIVIEIVILHPLR